MSVELDVGFEDVERPLADLAHVGAELVAAQDRQLVAGLARVLDRVVEAPELAVGMGSRPPTRWTSQSSSKLAMWPRSQASGLRIGE